MEELRSFYGTSERGCKTGKGWDELGEGVQKGTKTLSVLQRGSQARAKTTAGVKAMMIKPASEPLSMPVSEA